MKSPKEKLSVGIIRFPGSNCDFDTFNFFRKFGHKSSFIWYKETKLPQVDILVLPGGFAFGDRSYVKATGKYTIDPGTLALKSPVMKVIYDAAKREVPILGICNGFQILVKAKLLPGRLVQNDSKRFFCDYTTCKVSGRSFFSAQFLLGKSISIPVAHGYGKYMVDKNTLRIMKKNGQIFLKYKGFNPNGSVENIAGVNNRAGTIFGMMPHPERSLDGKYFMKAIEQYVGK